MNRDEATIKVEKIITNICGRRGIGNEFEDIDDEIKEEIKEKWISILMEP